MFKRAVIGLGSPPTQLPLQSCVTHRVSRGVEAEDLSVVIARRSDQIHYPTVVPLNASHDGASAEHRLESLVSLLASSGGQSTALLRTSDLAEWIAQVGQDD